MKTLILRKSTSSLLALGLPLALGQSSALGQTATTHGSWQIHSFVRTGADYTSDPEGVTGIPPLNRSWESYWTNHETHYGMYGNMTASAGSKTSEAAYNYPYTRQGAYSHKIGSIMPYMKWVPHYQYPDEQPPKFFWVKETAWAGARAETASASKLVASNGLGTFPVVTNGLIPLEGLPYRELWTSGDRVVKVKNPSRRPVKALELRKLHAEADVPSSTTDPKRVYVRSNLGYQVKEVHYSITSDIEESFYKAQRINPPPHIELYYRRSHDVAPPGQPDEWPHRNEMDKKKLDTVVEYANPEWSVDDSDNSYEGIPSLPEGFYGARVFSVSQDAFYSPQHKWTILGAGEVKGSLASALEQGESLPSLDFNTPYNPSSYWDSIMEGNLNRGLPHGKLFLGSNPQAFPLTTGLKVVTSEGDVGHVTGEFQVTWHLPREKTRELPAQQIKWLESKLVSINLSHADGDSKAFDVSSKKFDLGNIFEGASSYLEIFANFLPQARAKNTITVVRGALGLGQALSGAAEGLPTEFQYQGKNFPTAEEASEAGFAHTPANFNAARESDPNITGGGLHFNILDENLQPLSEDEKLFFLNHRDTDPVQPERDGYLFFNMEVWRVVYLYQEHFYFDSYNKNGFVDDGNVQIDRYLDIKHAPNGIPVRLERVYVRNNVPYPTPAGD